LRGHFFSTLHKVIDESDIIILVVDAQDPRDVEADWLRRKFGEEKARARN